MCALVSPAPPPVATKEEAPSEWWPGMLEGGTVAAVAGASGMSPGPSGRQECADGCVFRAGLAAVPREPSH